MDLVVTVSIHRNLLWILWVMWAYVGICYGKRPKFVHVNLGTCLSFLAFVLHAIIPDASISGTFTSPLTHTQTKELISIAYLFIKSFSIIYCSLGDLHYFLRIKVIRIPKGILISQWHYVLSMLFKFGMADCKPISAPLDRNVKLPQGSGKACNTTRFRQIVRSLIYLTIMTGS